MLITNIESYPDVSLYKCDSNIYIKLLKSGLTPVFIKNGSYYFLNNKELQKIIKIGGED